MSRTLTWDAVMEEIAKVPGGMTNTQLSALFDANKGDIGCLTRLMFQAKALQRTAPARDASLPTQHVAYLYSIPA